MGEVGQSLELEASQRAVAEFADTLRRAIGLYVYFLELRRSGGRLIAEILPGTLFDHSEFMELVPDDSSR